LTQPELGDPLAQHDATRHLGQWHAHRLRHERHRARRARVRLDHVQPTVVHRVLGVQQAHHAHTQRDVACGGPDLLEHLLAQRVWWQHARAVAGVHARLLHVLHDPADPNVVPVAEGVHVHLHGVLEEPVEEDR
jgi:hypothetical protein